MGGGWVGRGRDNSVDGEASTTQIERPLSDRAIYEYENRSVEHFRYSNRSGHLAPWGVSAFKSMTG